MTEVERSRPALVCHFLLGFMGHTLKVQHYFYGERYPLSELRVYRGHLQYSFVKDRNWWTKNHGQNAIQRFMPSWKRLYLAWRYGHLLVWFGWWTLITSRRWLKVGKAGVTSWESKLHAELRNTTHSFDLQRRRGAWPVYASAGL